MIEIHVPVIPPRRTAQGSLRIGKGGKMFKSANGAESDWLSILMPHRIATPMTGPISMVVVLVWPFAKKHLATKAARALVSDPLDKLPHDQKPDADNTLKALCDTMTKLGFWTDDKQLYEVTVRKFYGHQGSVSIKARTWEGDVI